MAETGAAVGRPGLRAGITALLLLLACSCSARTGHESVPAPGHLLLVNATVIDGRGGPALHGGYVLIGRGVILAVGQGSHCQVPEGCLQVQARGMTVLPGLIDAHNHVLLSPAEERCEYLARGVTTLGNVGSAMEDIPLLLREDGCRRVWSGPALTLPGGYPGVLHGRRYALEVGTVAQARAAVGRLQAGGAEMIKVSLEPGPPNADWPVMDREMLAAIVDEAHARGMTVRAHVEQGRYLSRALDAGVDTIEHVPLPRNARQAEEWAGQIAAAGVVLVPTLEAGSRAVWDNRPLLDFVRRVHARGGRVGLGTDAPFKGVAPGLPLVEMELLQRAGLRPPEVITAATVHAAAACGIGDWVGSLEPGKAADLMLVRGNPLKDLTALRDVALVVRSGEVVYSRLASIED
ncbi:MAG: amidohydrolase family protein [Desulfohalobiaceae bacterium]